MFKSSPARAALIALLVSDAGWGTTFFFMKWGAAGIEEALPPETAAAAPLLFLAYRFVLAAALLPLVLPGVVRRVTRRGVALGALLSLPFSAGFVLQVYGLRDTSPAVSAFLTSLFVLFTPLLAWALRMERPRASLWIGVALALEGLLLLTDPFAGRLGWGELLTIVSAGAFSAHILLTDWCTKRADPDVVTGSMLACAAGAMVIGAALWPGVAGRLAPAAAWDLIRRPPVAAGLATTVVLGSLLALVLMNRYQRHLEPSRAALIYTVEPVFATAFSVLFCAVLPVPFSETLTWMKLAGGALILAGNVWVEWRRGEGTEKRG